MKLTAFFHKNHKPQRIAQVPPMIADAIAQHEGDCPPRQTSARRRDQESR